MSDTKLPRPKGLTPYQGTNRCFGEFRCQCSSTWQSGNSWRDTYQECNSCGAKVYPHHQRPLQPSKDEEERPAHPSDKCEMCQKLGYNCRTVNKLQ